MPKLLFRANLREKRLRISPSALMASLFVSFKPPCGVRHGISCHPHPVFWVPQPGLIDEFFPGLNCAVVMSIQMLLLFSKGQAKISCWIMWLIGKWLTGKQIPYLIYLAWLSQISVCLLFRLTLVPAGTPSVSNLWYFVKIVLLTLAQVPRSVTARAADDAFSLLVSCYGLEPNDRR